MHAIHPIHAMATTEANTNVAPRADFRSPGPVAPSGRRDVRLSRGVAQVIGHRLAARLRDMPHGARDAITLLHVDGRNVRNVRAGTLLDKVKQVLVLLVADGHAEASLSLGVH